MIFGDDLGTEQIWYGGGVSNPSIMPGVDAPIGSSYRRTNGQVFAKTGIGLTDWELDGLGSAVFSQITDMGKSGNATANSFLNRSGQIASNISGTIILVGTGFITSVGCSNEDIDTYDVEIYQHEGDFINPVLKYTLSVVASRGNSVHGLSIPVTQDYQLAVKLKSGVRNVGCSIGMKGLSL